MDIRMNRKHLLAGIAAVIVICALPAGAAAKDGHFVIDASRSAEFRIKGSGEYSISVSGDHGYVYLTAQRGNSSAIYSVRGRASSSRIKARFGQLGRVSVRFHPDGPARLVPLPKGNCRGRGELVQTGAFVGAIEFEGEQAYTTLHASRGRGKVTTTLKQTCSRDTGGGGHKPATSWTILSATSESAHAIFSGFKVESRSHPRLDESAFVASITEVLPGPLVIFRSISTSASPDAFTSTESGGEVTSATITPPAPFSGAATFERKKGNRGTWTGSLTGEFLGRGAVSLAGADFVGEIAP